MGQERWKRNEERRVPQKRHCSYVPCVNCGINRMNQILFCQILLHGGAGHSTNCGLRGKRVPWFTAREYLGQCNEKQKESSAKDPEWLWLLLLFTSRNSTCMLCLMIQDAVFAMVPFHRWVLEELWEKNMSFGKKKKKKLSTNWHTPQNVPNACLCFSLPQKAWFIYFKIKLTNSGACFHVCSTHHP